MERLKVGLWSGLNYPDDGYRAGLGKAAKVIFSQEQIKFSVFVGGLVNQSKLKKRLRERIRYESKKPKDERRPSAEIEEEFYKEISDYLVKHFPALGVKTYLVTSPAYDGDIGEEIARRLAEQRKDIYHYSAKTLLPIKQLNNQLHLGVYAALKVVFKSKYFDTPIMNLLDDHWKLADTKMGDLNIVGPFGSSVFNPGAARDIKKPYASVPMLSKPSKIRTSENQLGVRILEIDSANLKESLISNYSFKDLVSKEGLLVQPPFRATEIQKAVVAAIGKNGLMTIGQLEEATGKNRDLVAKEVAALCEKKRTKNWPGLNFSEAQKAYGFNLEWFQKRLRYPLPKASELVEEAILGFGCMHAMCKWSDQLWFRDEVPKYCIEHNVQYLVGAGDFIEGLKHDLMLTGEVQSATRGPSNYTYQEKVAAYLVGKVMLTVFDHRAKEFLQNMGGKKPKQEDIMREVKKALLDFIFRPGNHCGWVKPLGFDSLGTFTPELRTMLVNEISDRLSDAGLVLSSKALRQLVKDKTVNITKKDCYILPSGLKLNVYHPEMGNTLTPSIRPQQVLGFSPNQIVVSANFHASESVDEWNYELGQRACLQVGTLKKRSSFEDGKLKIVDFGVGLLKVFSRIENRRIFKMQVAFFGIPKSDEALEADNERLVKEFEAYQQKNR